MPALCFLVVRAYYAKRICRILCVSLHVSTVVDQWADFRTVGVYAMLLSFSECSTELLGDRVWLEQASHQKTTEPHSWAVENRRRTLCTLCTCADFAGEIEHATLLHQPLPVSWFHWCETSLPSTTLSGEEVMKVLTPLHLQNYAPSCLFQENTVVMHFKVRVVTGVIIQLIFLQQYFPIPVPCNITQYCMGVIARALGLRGILAMMMCFN